MSISRGIYTWFFKKRFEYLEDVKAHPIDTQQKVFELLMSKVAQTRFGRDHNLSATSSKKEFVQRVPIRDYESLRKDYIQDVLEGHEDVIWPGQIKWFAKSSGTTAKRSKFIPMSTDCIEDCHFQGGKDAFGVYLMNHPDSKILEGRSLVLGGSHEINKLNEFSYYGDLSAVIMQNLPIWAELLRTPDLKTALHPIYEEKIEMMAEKTIDKNITNIVGVPTWTVVLFNRVLELSGKDHINEVWPNLELYVHGGVSFEPYKELFKKFIPSESMTYMETYNASEGFFGFQESLNDQDLLLMLDYGIYYEFMPMEEWEKDEPQTIGLEEVELDKNYALVISTNTGLWRYIIGDTVKFTNLAPYKIVVSGRTRHFINAFGEELIIENAEKAIAMASHLCSCSVSEFTAGPIYFGEQSKGAHEWYIEFDKEPHSLDEFTKLLDRNLQQLNSDYEAKRYRDMALTMPRVHQVPKGTFYEWFKSKGKLGGQNKVPRLRNDREVLDEIAKFLD